MGRKMANSLGAPIITPLQNPYEDTYKTNLLKTIHILRTAFSLIAIGMSRPKNANLPLDYDRNKFSHIFWVSVPDLWGNLTCQVAQRTQAVNRKTGEVKLVTRFKILAQEV